MTIRLLVLMALLVSIPQQATAKTYKIATISPDGLSWMKKLREGADEIATQTDGRVKFKIYPGGVQGDDLTVLRKIRIGQLQGGAVAAGSLVRFYKDLQVYNLPLSFRSFDEVDFVRGKMDQHIISGLESGGMVSFALTETGFAYILSKEPVRDVEDLKQLKAWVPENDPLSAEIIKSFGISPIPLNITDVLAGLQTGLINAVTVPPIVALALQWHNHVGYITDLPLMYIYSMLAMDAKAFKKMAPGDQLIVRNVMNQVFSEINDDNRTDNLKAYDALLSQGVQSVVPNLEQLPNWRAVANQSIEKLVREKVITEQGVELLETYLEQSRQTDGAAVSSAVSIE